MIRNAKSACQQRRHVRSALPFSTALLRCAPRRALGLIALLAPAALNGETVLCRGAAGQIKEAVAQIRHSVDPCSESGQIVELLEKLENCSTATYRLCTSTAVARNEFDRPIGPRGEALSRAITWNPELRSEIEQGCDGDPSKPVLRDPTASLLHELVHAVQDCEGLNPGEHELEAVRIENIYRRAAGLCQRSGYGDVPLPPEMTRKCALGDCSCSDEPSPQKNESLPPQQVRSHQTVLPLQDQTAAGATGDQPE